jgi:RNA polymerase sigma-70 factor (ECF subfamily)
VDELSLIEAAQRGDPAAYQQLFAQYSRRVFQAAYLILGDRSGAEDVLQEAFLQTFRYLHKLRAPGAFAAWLYRIAVREARRRSQALQNERFFLRSLAREAPVTSPDLALPSAQRELVRGALERLPEQQRTAVVLHYFADRPLQEIAQAMGVPEGTVKSWLHRAKRKLADLLGTEEGIAEWSI